MNPYDFILLGCLLTAILSAYGLGFTLGHNQGVKETEKRWSDAVSKKESHDAYR